MRGAGYRWEKRRKFAGIDSNAPADGVTHESSIGGPGTTLYARPRLGGCYCAVRKVGDTPNGTAQSGGESDEGRRPAPLGGVRGEGRALASHRVQARGPSPRTEQRGGRCSHYSALRSKSGFEFGQQQRAAHVSGRIAAGAERVSLRHIARLADVPENQISSFQKRPTKHAMAGPPGISRSCQPAPTLPGPSAHSRCIKIPRTVSASPRVHDRRIRFHDILARPTMIKNWKHPSTNSST